MAFVESAFRCWELDTFISHRIYVQIRLVKALVSWKEPVRSRCNAHRRLHTVRNIVQLDSIPCFTQQGVIHPYNSCSRCIFKKQRLWEERNAFLVQTQNWIPKSINATLIFRAKGPKRTNFRHIRAVGIVRQTLGAFPSRAEGIGRALLGIWAIRPESRGGGLAHSLVAKSCAIAFGRVWADVARGFIADWGRGNVDAVILRLCQQELRIDCTLSRTHEPPRTWRHHKRLVILIQPADIPRTCVILIGDLPTPEHCTLSVAALQYQNPQ